MPTDNQQNKSKRVIGVPFKPGQSGNPKGRPKGTTIPALLNRLLGEPTPEQLRVKVLEFFPDAGDTMLETILRGVVAKAIMGEQWAVQFISDRTEGKAKETVELLTEKPPIKIEILREPPPDGAGEGGDDDTHSPDAG